MISKLTLYRFAGMPNPAFVLGGMLLDARFVPTGPTQEKSAGFVPPRQANGAMVEDVAGAWIAKVMIERRSVPSAALKKRVDEVCAKIEEETGRKPGKKERRQIKEDALLALLPQAFPKQAAVPVWISKSLLAIGATSTGVLDEVISLLVHAVDGLRLQMIQTAVPPGVAMTQWLSEGEAPGEFALGTECELRSHDETKAEVRYTNHHLLGDDVRRHLSEGKIPRRLGLSWRDRVAFRLSDTMAIDKVEMLDLAMESKADSEVDQFDADVAIYTGELSGLIEELIDALGGEMLQTGSAA